MVHLGVHNDELVLVILTMMRIVRQKYRVFLRKIFEWMIEAFLFD